MFKTYLIGDLARLVGVDAKTIRFYEESGVLPEPARLPNGYRAYHEDDAARLRFVRGARAMGFTLADIREIMAFRDRGEAPCRYVIDLLGEKMTEIDRRIEELQALRAELESLNAAAAQLPTDDIDMKNCVCELIQEQSPA